MSLPPSGEIPQGAIRFNTDSQRLEFYAQGEWWVMSTDTPNLGRSVDPTPGARGLFAGGYASGASSPKATDKINYVNIASTGNAQEFGTLSTGAGQDVVNCGASRTRGVFRDGNSASMTFITFASTGNSVTFGNSGLTANRASGLSNETRGIHGGSGTSTRNQLEYITIASTGNAVDFGNLVTGAHSAGTGASATRGIYAGCAAHPTNNGNAIEFITISTLGNAADFGDLQYSGNSYQTASASNSTRMFVMDVNVIEFIQIQTLGNAIDFGETSTSVDSRGGGCASPTRALFGGGADPAVSIEYIEISTQGNAVDFGDLTYIENRHGCGMSNGHGGL
jgi:hypothetical protein